MSAWLTWGGAVENIQNAGCTTCPEMGGLVPLFVCCWVAGPQIAAQEFLDQQSRRFDVLAVRAFCSTLLSAHWNVGASFALAGGWHLVLWLWFCCRYLWSDGLAQVYRVQPIGWVCPPALLCQASAMHRVCKEVTAPQGG